MIGVPQAAKIIGVDPTNIRVCCRKGIFVGAKHVKGKWAIPLLSVMRKKLDRKRLGRYWRTGAKGGAQPGTGKQIHVWNRVPWKRRKEPVWLSVQAQIEATMAGKIPATFLNRRGYPTKEVYWNGN